MLKRGTKAWREWVAKTSKSAKKAWADKKTRARHAKGVVRSKKKRSKLMKKAWADPGHRKNWAKGSKKSKRKRSKAVSKAWKDPEKRARLLEGTIRGHKKKSCRKNLSTAGLKVWERDGYKERQSKSHKRYYKKHPEARKRSSDGGKKPWKNKAFVKKHAKIHSKLMTGRWKTKEWAAKVRLRPSKPQISLFKKLCRLFGKGWKLEHHVGTYHIDIANPGMMLAIEVDGAHWHQDKKHDKKRDKYLAALGWAIIRVPATKAAIEAFPLAVV